MTPSFDATGDSQEAAKRNLWLHFTRMSAYADSDVPVIVRGSGPYVYDQHGKRYLDGLSGLFVSQVGHGRTEIAEAGARQAAELAYFPLWSYAHPKAIELAARLAELAPGDLNRVFFTTSGSEAVESAWKLAKQYFKLTGQPGRYKVISRDIAYHGTSMGALAITGLADIKYPFEPLTPGGVRVPNTNFYRAPAFVRDDLEAFGRWAADEIERAILREGPQSVAAVYLEPVQNSGGCFPPPPGYFQRVREICDRYGVLLVSDEVICAFGRIGYYFGSERYGYQPDIITFAKGLTSGYSPMGGMLVRDALMEPFTAGTATFLHGITFAGHPVSAAVALANLDIFEKEDLLGNVRANEAAFRATLEKLSDLPIVGDVRGAGYFYGIELVKDKATRETFNDDESERLLRGFLSQALFDAGLVCRADDRGDPVIQLAPPLICGQEHFDEIERILRAVLTEAWTRVVTREGGGDTVHRIGRRDIPSRHLTFTRLIYVSVMPGNSDSSRPSRSAMSRRQVLAGAGGTSLLAATAGTAKAATRSRKARAGARAGAGDGTPEQIHLTWGESPATGVVVSWASAGQAARPRVRVGQRVIPAETRQYTDGINGETVWTYHAHVNRAAARRDVRVRGDRGQRRRRRGSVQRHLPHRTARPDAVPLHQLRRPGHAEHRLGAFLRPERVRGRGRRVLPAAVSPAERGPVLRGPEPDRAAPGMAGLRQQQPDVGREPAVDAVPGQP